jgi:hypothetical protein
LYLVISYMPDQVMIQVVVVAVIMVIAYVAYKIMGDGAAYTAAHEMGHGIMVKYYGGSVHKVVVNPHGRSGYTSFDPIVNPKHAVRVMVAGYVAEEIARGRIPQKVIKGGAYEGDMAEIRRIVGRDEEEVARAIDAVYKVISKPVVQEYIKQQVEVLVAKGEIDGSSVKMPQ